MHNNKSYIIYMLAFLLFPMPSFSVLINTGEKDTQISSVYISTQYRSSISLFAIQDINSKAKNLIGLNRGIKSSNTANFSSTIGYSSNGIRVELEGAYTGFLIKTYNIQHTSESQGSGITGKMLSITSIIVNTCYNIITNNSLLIPYLCTGIGGDIIKIPNITYFNPSYQGKLGISYSIKNNFILFASIYYHKIIGMQFKDLYAQHAADPNNHKTILALTNFDIGYFGSEVGIKVIFNKQ